MDLPSTLITLMSIAVVVYLVTIVHVATVRMLEAREGAVHPESRLLAWPKWLWALVAGLLVIWLLWRVRSILPPFVVGAVLAYVLNPEIDRLEQRGWSRTRAIAVVFGLFLVVFVAAGVLAIPAVAGEARDLLSGYQSYVAQIGSLADQLRVLVEKWGAPVGVVPSDVEQWFSGLSERAQSYALSLLTTGLAWLKSSLAVLSLLVITPVVTFWLLRDYHTLARRVLASVPEERRTAIVSIMKDVNRVAGGYLLGLMTIACLMAVYASSVLTLAGVRFSILLGVGMGILSTIPYLGFPSGLVIVVLTMAATGERAGPIVVVGLLLIGGNMLSDYVVAPRVIGRRVGIHPLCVIFSLLAGGALFGFLGIVLAVPVAGAIKVILVHYWPEIFAPPSAEAEAG